MTILIAIRLTWWPNETLRFFVLTTGTPFTLWPKLCMCISFLLWLPFSIGLLTSWTSKIHSCMVSCKKKLIWIKLLVLQLQVSLDWYVRSTILSIVWSSLLIHGLVILTLPYSSLEWLVVRLITQGFSSIMYLDVASTFLSMLMNVGILFHVRFNL